MSATIIKKTYPPVFPLVKRLLCSSLCLVLLTQNVHMAIATEEDDPLLTQAQRERVAINDTIDVRVTIPQTQTVDQLQVIPPVQFDPTLRNPIANVQYVPTILAPVDKTAAENQYRALSDFVQCAYSQGYYEKVALRHEKAAQEKMIKIDTQENLLIYLKEPAMQALLQKPNLAGYLRERREQTEALILAINDFIAQDGLLRKRNEALLEAFEQFINTDAQLREQNRSLLEKISRQKQKRIKAIQYLETRYKCHMALLGVGGLIFSVGCFFLGHYVWPAK